MAPKLILLSIGAMKNIFHITIVVVTLRNVCVVVIMMCTLIVVGMSHWHHFSLMHDPKEDLFGEGKQGIA